MPNGGPGQPPGGVLIRAALRDETEVIAAVVREGFRSEAAVYGDIPPLHETAADVEATFDAGDVTLVAEVGDTVVGTVRGETGADGRVMVRRLAVLPKYRRKGIGRWLLIKLEAAYPEATCFELFTGGLNDAALGLYEDLGYRRINARTVIPGVDLVTLEKRRD